MKEGDKYSTLSAVLGIVIGILAGQRSGLPGVFLAGAATGPKTLPETVAEARAAVVEIDRYLSDIFPDVKNYKTLVRERW